MHTALSNSLSLATAIDTESTPVVSQETTSPVPAWFITLLATGMILLLIWLARKAMYPKRWSLANTPGRRNRLDLLLLIAMIIFAFSVCGFLSAGVFEGLKLVIPEPKAELCGMLTLQVLELPAWILIAHWGFHHGLAGMGLTLRRWKTGLLRGVVTALIAIPVCLFLQSAIIYFAKLVGIDGDLPAHPLMEAFHTGALPWKLLVAVIAVVMAPLTEEILFRGLLQSGLRRTFRNPWIAIAIASIIFGAVHYPMWPSIIPLMLFAAMLGYNYERTGKLLSPIIAHAIFNAVFLLTGPGGT
jgi:membrane protease YdiL (CAAX protease family)